MLCLLVSRGYIIVRTLQYRLTVSRPQSGEEAMFLWVTLTHLQAEGTLVAMVFPFLKYYG